MSAINPGDWYNIPEIVQDKLLSLEKRINYHETRADKLEVITARLQRENEQLMADNKRLNDRIGELTLQMASPDEAFIQGLQTRLQNCINPEFLRPILERQLATMKANFEDEFEKLYTIVDQKVSADRVAENLAQHFNEVASETQKFTVRLQDVLRSKADTAKVNEILQLKADLATVKEHVERTVAMQMRQYQQTVQDRLEGLADPTELKQLKLLFGELQKQTQADVIGLRRMFQQQYEQLEELRIQTKANTQQIATASANGDEILRVERQMKSTQENAIRHVVEPLITAQEQLRKRIQIVESGLEKRRFQPQ